MTSPTPARWQLALRRPGHAWRVAVALAKGFVCKLYYGLLRGRLVAGKGLRVEGTLSIRGPGIVRLGDRVRVGEGARLWTYTRDAEIVIGDDAYLNGVHLWCARRIAIGARAILGRAEIIDSDFHSVHRERHDPRAPVRTLAVELGDNVWVGARAAILPGVVVGNDAVVGYGAVCARSVEAGQVVAGNPARTISSVPAEPLPGRVGEEPPE